MELIHAEVLLDNKECESTTINVCGLDENGNLDMEGLLEAQRLSARAAYRMTCGNLSFTNGIKYSRGIK